MDKYRRVPKTRATEHPDDMKDSEIRVTSRRFPRTYVSYAVGILENKEKECSQITLHAMGKAISVAVQVAEQVKRSVEGLHQITKFDSTEIVDKYEPTVQGLDAKEVSRKVSTITITLSKTQLDKNDPGYQVPLPDEVVRADKEAQEKRREEGQKARAERNAQRELKEKERAEAGDSGRGRGRRGRGRGEAREERDDRDSRRGRGGERRGRAGGRGDSGRGRRGGERREEVRGGRGGRGGRYGDRGGNDYYNNDDYYYTEGRGRGRYNESRGGGRGGRSEGGRGGRGGRRGRGY